MSELNKKFGKQIRDEHFSLDKSLTFCNHGSYGTVPKKVFSRKQKLQQEIESAPDKWFRYTSRKEWISNKQKLADFLKVDYQNILICENATESINAALKSIEFNGSNDALLCTEYTYKAISNSVDYITRYRMGENNVQVFKVPLRLPIKNKQQIIDEFEELIDEIINKKKT